MAEQVEFTVTGLSAFEPKANKKTGAIEWGYECDIPGAGQTEIWVRIPQQGLQEGQTYLASSFESWPYQGKTFHRLNGPIVPISQPATTPPPTPSPGAPSATPPAPAPGPSGASPQEKIDGLQAFGSAMISVTTRAFQDGRGTGCHVEEFRAVFGTLAIAADRKGLLQDFIDGYRPEGTNDGPPPDDDIPF